MAAQKAAQWVVAKVQNLALQRAGHLVAHSVLQRVAKRATERKKKEERERKERMEKKTATKETRISSRSNGKVLEANIPRQDGRKMGLRWALNAEYCLINDARERRR